MMDALDRNQTEAGLFTVALEVACTVVSASVNKRQRSAFPVKVWGVKIVSCNNNCKNS
jgi:hypothetical protein